MLQVLIVDDNASFRHQLAELLRRAGATTVREAGDMAQALQLAEGCALDLAVVDVLLPAMDGLKGGILLHTLCPELPIVVVSAYPQFRSAALAMGAGAFCAKEALDLDTVRCWLQSLSGASASKGGSL